MNQMGYFFKGFLGLFIMLGVAFLFSQNRKKISWKLVLYGTGLQFFFAILVLKTGFGRSFFAAFNDAVLKVLSFSDQGASFVFGNLVSDFKIGAIFAFKVLPTIIFFSSLISILYYLGVMQFIVKIFAVFMMKVLGTSGAETLSCSANIFVGQTEAPLLIKPFVETMTNSELLTIMTGGFATVAGGVMAAYVGMLVSTFPDIAGHLLSASIMNAPGAIVMSKIILPETEEPKTMGTVKVDLPLTDANVLDAAANGAGQGMQLAMNVGAMILAFIALIGMIDFSITKVGGILLNDPSLSINADGTPAKIMGIESLTVYKVLLFVGLGLILGHFFGKAEKIADKTEKMGKSLGLDRNKSAMVSGLLVSLIFVVLMGIIGNSYNSKIPFAQLNLSLIFGWLFAPVAWVMGVPWKDCVSIGGLFGKRLVINEFVSYAELADMLNKGVSLDPRSVMIATYAMCGFANFSSIAIQIGGIGGIAPSRRADLAKLGLVGVLAGTLATFQSATIAGMLESQPKMKMPQQTIPTEEAPQSFNENRKSFSRYAAAHMGVTAQAVESYIDINTTPPITAFLDK